MANNNSGEGSAIAFILGGVIGGVLGLLLAPRKGEETRELLTNWLEEKRKKTENFIDNERKVISSNTQKIGEAWEAGKKAFTKPSNGKTKHVG